MLYLGSSRAVGLGDEVCCDGGMDGRSTRYRASVGLWTVWNID